jgi:hypothetical protein
MAQLKSQILTDLSSQMRMFSGWFYPTGKGLKRPNLDVSVGDIVFVEVFNSEADLVEDGEWLLFCERFLSFDEFEEVPLFAAFENYEEVVTVFNDFYDFHDIGTAQPSLKLDLGFDVLLCLELRNLGFRNLFRSASYCVTIFIAKSWFLEESITSLTDP